MRLVYIIIALLCVSLSSLFAEKSKVDPSPEPADGLISASDLLYLQILSGKFKDALKLSKDPELNKALERILSLNHDVAESYKQEIGNKITLTVDGLPLTGTLTKIKNNRLYMKLNRGKGSVVIAVGTGKLPLSERMERVNLPELSVNLCTAAKFTLHHNYQAALVFISKTGKYAEPLRKAMTKKSRYFLSLAEACRKGDLKKIDALIKMGGDINNKCSAMIQDPRTKKYRQEYSNLLIETIKMKKKESAEHLIEKGAKVNSQNSQGVSPLMFAIAMLPDEDFIKYLIKHKADVNHKDMQGNTPLSGAIAMRRNKIVQILLDSGADPDDATSKGLTPIMIAVLSNNLQALNMLLKAGADINKPHPKGWTVFQLDRQRMSPEIRAILKKLEPPKEPSKPRTLSINGVDVIHK